MDKDAERVTVSVRYLMDVGLWDSACEAAGISPWAVHEGQMDNLDTVSVSINAAEAMGLLPTRSSPAWRAR
jgi:hypothetical protein